jgi:diguanylate cyclase (GGDEF)-like protein
MAAHRTIARAGRRERPFPASHEVEPSDRLQDEAADARSSPATRVWLYILLVFLLALTTYLAAVRPLVLAGVGSAFAWPLLAAVFVFTELKVVDVHLRGERHSFSLSEIPSVVGLFGLAVGDFLLALVVGTGIALMIDHRQSRLKRVFNLANTMLGGVLAVAVFAHLRGVDAGSSVPGPQDWLAACLATSLVSVTGGLTVSTVIALSGAPPQLERLSSMIRFGGMVALANTSLALLAVTIIAINPLGIALLSIPVATVFFAYRAYVSEREKTERLEDLYESSRILHHSPELDSATVALLDHARNMFRAEEALLVLFPDPAQPTGVKTMVETTGRREVMQPITLDPSANLRRRIRDEVHAFFWRSSDAAGLIDRPIVQAMASPLRGESGPLGVMLIVNRISEGTTFDQQDLRVLETVANQVGVALENGQLERSLAELQRLKDELRHQAYHDALTGLPNRALFAETVGERLRRSPGAEPVVMFLDLDDFKIVNDTLGHAIGDQLLVAVTERIRACVHPGTVAARLGGDEFGVLLPEHEGMREAIGMANRIVDELAVTFPLGDQDIAVGVSIGIASGRPGLERVDDLLRNADVAMYTAKANGKRRIAVFDPLMHAELVARHELSADLARAVARGDLYVHFQPIVELKSGRVAGVEALARWRHPRRGMIAPDEFIRLAEESGTIGVLGHWMMTAACQQMARWRTILGKDSSFFMTVNVSPYQLHQADFVEEVERVLTATGADPHDLILEMTETAMFNDVRSTIEKLDVLRHLGVRIAIDDFGTGWSSLSYLRRFPVDILKIAREFMGPTVDVPTDDDGWAFAHAIIALGRTLGLSIIAEGIEHAHQHARLKELACEYGQGYLFVRPSPATIVEGLLTVDQLPARADTSAA